MISKPTAHNDTKTQRYYKQKNNEFKSVIKKKYFLKRKFSLKQR